MLRKTFTRNGFKGTRKLLRALGIVIKKSVRLLRKLKLNLAWLDAQPSRINFKRMWVLQSAISSKQESMFGF